MKTKTMLTFAIGCLLCMLPISAQELSLTPQGGEVSLPSKTEPCLTESERSSIKHMLEENIASLAAEGRLLAEPGKGTHPLFDWPVAQASGFEYGSVWGISNYLDQNTAFPNQITDYNCGSRSYDTASGYNHQGYDIYTWPFWWKQMELNQAINIAAADGQIIGKVDGSFDRNCDFNSDPANAVFLQHSDGSITWYLHMKNGALTSKGVGESVTQGEFLGVIGSSGSSTGPHLHFETYDSNSNLIDPNVGPCNSLNSDTWWNNQKPYNNPNVNAALTHSAPPQFQACPETEITNESNHFASGDLALFAIYLVDQEAGTSTHLKITRPNGTVFQEWDFSLVDNFQLSYWYWEFVVDMEGEWTWEATYNGSTTSHTFSVGTLDVEANELEALVVYPNPTSGEIHFSLGTTQAETKISITNMLGQVISENTYSNTSQVTMPLEGASGLYFATIQSENGATKTVKIIKQ